MYELKGKLLIKEDVQQVSGTFKKRDFVIEVENEKDPKWNDFVKFQLTQDNCSKIDACNVGDTINVSFNVRGRKWEKDGKVSYFTNLEGWKIEKETASGKVVDTSMSQEYPPSASEGADDLPF